MVTKSGSNEFHGTGFWFYRTPRLNANEWENNLDAIGKRQYVQHIFGGDLGGPIMKNKLFFYANGQGLRTLETAVADRTVYTAEARKGILRYVKGGRNRPAGTSGASVDFAGNVLPGVQIGTYSVPASDPQRIGLDPTIQALINQTPLPNRFDLGDGLNTAVYRFTAPQMERQHDIVTKFDYILNPQNTLYARIAWGRQDTNCDRVNGGQEIFPGTGCFVNTERSPQNMAYNWRWNPRPEITNEFVFGRNQFGFNFDTPPASLDKITLNGPVDTLAQYYFGNIRFLRTWQVVDNLAWFKGAHSLKFGTNLRLQRHIDTRGSVAGLNSSQDANFSTGVNTVDPATFGIPSDINTTFDRPAFQSNINFLLGRVGTTTKAFVAKGDQFTPGLYDFAAHFNEYDFYVQDTWKARRNLTIDIGLRWEPKMAPTNPDGRISHPNQLVTAGAAPSNTLKWTQGALYSDAWKNFGPSIGFAWDPFGEGKTSIRSNYRIAFDRINTFLLSSAVFQNLPGNTIGVVNTDYGQSGGRLPNLPKLQPPATKPTDLQQPIPFSSNSITVLDPAFKTPTTHQWALSIQREIFKRTVLDVSYIGRRGYHLFGAYNANQAQIFNNGFVDAFKIVKAGGESDLINRLTAADSRKNAGESGSAMVRRLYSSNLDLNAVASLASALATRLQGGRSVTDLSGMGAFPIIAYPQFGGGVNVVDANDFSTYHALEVQLERRMASGIYGQISYTWAKSLDSRSYDPAFTVVSGANNQSASSTPWDINNRKLNYAPSDFDRTHVLQGSWVIEMPFGKGKRFGSSAPGIVNRIIGGWEWAGAMQLYSGRPFTVYAGANTFSSVVQSRANCNGCGRDMGTVFDDPASGFKWYFSDGDRAKFSAPGPGELGNTGRNMFRGPRLFNIDSAFLKRIPITERVKMELRADMTNLTNTPSFGFPTLTMTSTIFGRIRNGVVSGSRKIQLGTKIFF